MIALFMTATAISSVIAGPLGGAIMKYANGAGGLHGWQWLFIIEGLPAAILGIVAYLYLQDKPEDANWLTTALFHDNDGVPLGGERRWRHRAGQ